MIQPILHLSVTEKMIYWIVGHHISSVSWLKCEFDVILGVTRDEELANEIVTQFESNGDGGNHEIDRIEIMEQREGDTDVTYTHLLTQFDEDGWQEDSYLVILNAEEKNHEGIMVKVPYGWVPIDPNNPLHEYSAEITMNIYDPDLESFATLTELKVSDCHDATSLRELIPDLLKCMCL